MFPMDEEVLRAVIRLAGHEEWDVLCRWLQKCFLCQSARNNGQRDDVLLRMGQGRALAFEELSKAFDPKGARAMLDRMKEKH